MLQQVATAVSNLPWWRRRTWRWWRAAGDQGGVLDKKNETHLHVLRQQCNEMRNQEQILQAAQVEMQAAGHIGVNCRHWVGLSLPTVSEQACELSSSSRQIS